MGNSLNAADQSTDNGGARNDAPPTVPPGDRRIAGQSAPQPNASVRGKGGSVSWRTVPTFVAGVLATLAVALVVLCRGPARADSAVTDRMVRWWAAVWLRAAGARVVVQGQEHVSPASAYVVVSNHQSNMDPMVHLRALPGAGPAGRHRWHLPDLAARANRDPRRPGTHRGRKPPADQRPDPSRHSRAA